MSKFLVCYKWVVDEADIKINSDQTIDIKRAKGKISDYDRNAIEAAVQAAKAAGGTAVGLTFGSAKVKESLKDALSRGLDEVYWINADQAAETADGHVTAKALAAAIAKIGDVSAIICADGASDTYARQTASRIAVELDIPAITAVLELHIEGKSLTAVRRLDNTLETVKADTPVVISVLPELNTPTAPGLKAVMAAGKKPMTELKPADLGVDLTPRNKVVSVKAYVMNRKNVIFKTGNAAEKVQELVTSLKREGVA